MYLLNWRMGNLPHFYNAHKMYECDDVSALIITYAHYITNVLLN
jgi:hypothetical protein